MKKKLYLYFFIALLIQMFFYSNTDAKKVIRENTPLEEYKYQQKVLRQEEVEKYKRSLLPESGAMTMEEYENRSRDVSNYDKKIPEPQVSKDIKMKYVPQPTYKLVRYNDPPGSPELHLKRKFYYDRQINGQSITSPNKDILVYPVVYYYADNQCTAGDLFVIPLDKTLPDVERVLRANIIKREEMPILSTTKDEGEKFTFRSMTPIDFSQDGSMLIAKEKIGNINDGIWQTNLWVYNFRTQQGKHLSEVRDAIRFYWYTKERLMLDDKRWDIYPLGFEADDSTRVVVSAYGYTGLKPKFLGIWSVDIKGEQSRLVSLFEYDAKVSANGFKVIESGIINPVVVMEKEKQLEKTVKKKKKEVKKAKSQDKKEKKQALKKKLSEMKKEEKTSIKQNSKQMKTTGPTGAE